MDFTSEETERYSRQIMLSSLGGAGQKKLSEAKVLVVGAGGLGSPALYYLAAAGVGTIGISDPDTVDITNLQRQILFTTEDVGKSKPVCAADNLREFNPHITYHTHAYPFEEANADELIKDNNYTLLLDGSDNIKTRLLTNNTSLSMKIPLISGAVKGFEGQLSVFKGYKKDSPCYQCLYPHLDPKDTQDSCIGTGIIGATAGIIGSMMALEAIKAITNQPHSLTGKLLLYNGLNGQIRTTGLEKDTKCSCSLVK